jgi:putative transposase
MYGIKERDWEIAATGESVGWREGKSAIGKSRLRWSTIVEMINVAPIRAKIRRLYVPDALYFITGVTKDRRPILAEAADMELFRVTMREAKEYYPFTMRAYVFLPDHFHLLIFVPKTTNVSKLLQSIKRNYSRNYTVRHQLEEPVRLWQRGFWDHVVRDEGDFVNHFHYIHYNPVKHGYVMRPEDWPHSSYGEYVRREWYEIGWGHNEPEHLKGFDYE